MMLVLLASQAFACGGFFGPEGQVVSSDAQQALLTVGTGYNSVEYRVRYQGTAQEFGWVLPVLGGVETVEEGDDGRFDALQEHTAPRIYDGTTQGEEEGVGCGCVEQDMSLKSGDVGDSGAAGGVDVTGHGFTGTYEYTILAASDGQALRDWLDEAGFDISTAGDVIDAYVADERGYEFVAVRVAPDAASPELDTTFKPLRITYGAAVDGELHLNFPAKMGSTSTAEENSLQLYVLGEGLAEVGGGWTAEELGDLSVPDSSGADEFYDDTLRSLGAEDRKLGLVYAGDYRDGEFVTRFDLILDPKDQTADIEFSDSGEQEWIETSLTYTGDEDAQTDAVARGSLLLAVGALGASLRRLRR